MIAKILLAVVALASASAASGCCSSASRAGQPAAAKVARPDPAVGLRGPALVLLAVFLVYPAAGTILRSFQDNDGRVHARQLRGA